MVCRLLIDRVGCVCLFVFGPQQLKDEIAEVTAEMESMDNGEERSVVGLVVSFVVVVVVLELKR